MSPHATWNRRTFISTAGLVTAAAISPQLLAAELVPLAYPAAATPFLACVGFSATTSPSSHRIEIYRVENGRWLQLDETTSCEAPRALAMHPVHPILYVAHATGNYLDRPRGSVSAFAVNVASGAFAFLGIRPLALSATYPDHLAICPDGRTLLASASGGGSYNVLSLDANGAFARNFHVLKQVGCGPHPTQRTARPHAAVFHPVGLAAYSSDLGADRINQINFTDGTPIVAGSVSLAPGTGPGHIALHPSGKIVVVSSQLRPELIVVALHQPSGRLGSVMQQLRLETEVGGPISFGTTGDYLYLAGKVHSSETTLSTFRTDHGYLRLRATTTVQIPSLGPTEQLLVHGDDLLLVGAGGVVILRVDHHTGLIREQLHVIRKSGAASMAILSL